jgi:hypothetical protein
MNDLRITTKVELIRSNEIIAMPSRVNSQVPYKWGLPTQTYSKREPCLLRINPLGTPRLKIIMLLHNPRAQII